MYELIGLLGLGALFTACSDEVPGKPNEVAPEDEINFTVNTSSVNSRTMYGEENADGTSQGLYWGNYNNTSTDGLATITGTLETDTKHGCVIDMKKALSYPTSYPVQSATRTIYVDNLDVLHIEDLIRANSSKDASVTWTMVTGATPTISGNDIILVKNGKRMKLSVTPSTAQAYVTNCAGQNSYDVENPGMSRVGFTHTISKGQQASINVQLEPLND